MKSYVVIGLGRFGSVLAMKLYEMGNEVLVIDEDSEVIQRISDHVTHAVIGNATDEMVLRSVGIRNFDCAIVSVASDIQASVLITLMLKELGVKNVVAKAQSEIHMKVLKRIGADRIVFPERDMAARLAQSLAETNVLEFIELSDEFSIIEMKPIKSWVSKTLKEIDLRSKHGVNVIAVRDKKTKQFTVSPLADYVISADDLMIIVGKNSVLENLSKQD